MVRAMGAKTLLAVVAGMIQVSSAFYIPGMPSTLGLVDDI